MGAKKRKEREARRLHQEAVQQKRSQKRKRRVQEQDLLASALEGSLGRAALHKEKCFPELIELISKGTPPRLDECHPLTPLTRMQYHRGTLERAFVIRVCRQVAQKAPHMFGVPCNEAGDTYATALVRLGVWYDLAIRRPEEWQVTKRSAHSCFDAIVDHLFVTYPTHPSLRAYLSTHMPRADLMDSFFALSAGTSLKQVPLPVTLTKKMRHLFLQSPRRLRLIEALRWAQLTALGASEAMKHAFLHSCIGEEIMEHEPFWVSVMTWFVNHWDGPKEQIGPVIDYIRTAKEQDADFCIKGRTTGSLMRLMKSWHRELGAARHIDWVAFASSGFRPFKAEEEETGMTWQIKEIRDSIALYQEGAKMGHCVYSYIGECKTGRTSIWSMTCADHNKTKRALTIEVNNLTRCVVQVRGKSNRLSRSNERKWLQEWARQNRLTERFY